MKNLFKAHLLLFGLTLFYITLDASFDPQCHPWIEEKDVSYNYMFCDSKIATLSVGSHPQAFYIGFYNFLFSQMHQEQDALFPIYNSAITPPGPYISHFTISSATYDHDPGMNDRSHSSTDASHFLGPQYVAYMAAVNVNHTDQFRIQSQVLDFSIPNHPRQICRLPRWSCCFHRIQMEMNARAHLLYYLDPCSGDFIISHMAHSMGMSKRQAACKHHFDAYTSLNFAIHCDKMAALDTCSSITVTLDHKVQSFVVDQQRKLVLVLLNNRTMTVLDGTTGTVKSSFHYFVNKEPILKMVYDSRRGILYAASTSLRSGSYIHILNCEQLARPRLVALMALPRHRLILDIAVNSVSGYFHYLTHCPTSLALPYTWVTMSPSFQICRDISTGDFDPTSFAVQGDYVYFQGKHKATSTYVAFRFHFKCCHKHAGNAFQPGVFPPFSNPIATSRLPRVDERNTQHARHTPLTDQTSAMPKN